MFLMSTPTTPSATSAQMPPQATLTGRFGAVFASILPMMRTRPRRVIVLAISIMMMSAVDLYLTLLYVTNTGMNEMNPFARAMMSYQSPSVLAIWKLTTVALSLGILILIRTKRSAELGAWVGCFVLGWLMMHWVHFVHETRDISLQIVQELATTDPTWVVIEAAPRELQAGRIVID